jgi:DNA-directed RNA polymerase subunit RPC12/RpoP
MDITFECPHCGQSVAIDEAGAGLQIDCPRCRSPLTVPRPLPENAPQYRCTNPRCGAEWPEDHLLREDFEGRIVLLCPKCRHGATKITEPIPFRSRVAGAFAYPLLGNGVWILIGGTLALVLLDVVGKGLLWIFMAVAVIGSFGMLLLSVIRGTANAEEDSLEWPDVRSVDDLREAICQVGGPALLVFSPAIICRFALPGGAWHPLTLCLWGVGAAYFPMALLAIAMFDSVSGINPLIVVPAIVKTLPHYLLVLAVLASVWLIYEGTSVLVSALPWGLGLIFYLPLQFYSCYALVVAGRLLGLLYQSNAEKLGWLD